MADETKKRDLTHVEFAENPPQWVKPSDLSFIRSNDEIKTVIDFFVVHSPCTNVSARRIDLTQYLWKESNPPKNKYLYNRLLAVANLVENDSLFLGDSVDTTKTLFQNADMDKDFWSKYITNRVALVNSGNLIMAIFRAIRNGFAHCRFTIISQDEDYLIAMENGEPKTNRFEVKARLILKLSTLVEWVRIIKEGHREEEEYERKRALQVEDALLEVIRTNGDKKIDEIIARVPFERSIVNEAKKRLITNAVIEYSRKKRKWIIKSEETDEHTNC